MREYIEDKIPSEEFFVGGKYYFEARPDYSWLPRELSKEEVVIARNTLEDFWSHLNTHEQRIRDPQGVSIGNSKISRNANLLTLPIENINTFDKILSTLISDLAINPQITTCDIPGEYIDCDGYLVGSTVHALFESGMSDLKGVLRAANAFDESGDPIAILQLTAGFRGKTVHAEAFDRLKRVANGNPIQTLEEIAVNTTVAPDQVSSA